MRLSQLCLAVVGLYIHLYACTTCGSYLRYFSNKINILFSNSDRNINHWPKVRGLANSFGEILALKISLNCSLAQQNLHRSWALGHRPTSQHACALWRIPLRLGRHWSI